jgi:DNA-binding GntR family transcriptional regulator
MGEVLRRPRLTLQIWKEHAGILEAMAKGEADEAARRIGEHVRVAHQRVSRELIALAPAEHGRADRERKAA